MGSTSTASRPGRMLAAEGRGGFSLKERKRTGDALNNNMNGKMKYACLPRPLCRRAQWWAKFAYSYKLPINVEVPGFLVTHTVDVIYDLESGSLKQRSQVVKILPVSLEMPNSRGVLGILEVALARQLLSHRRLAASEEGNLGKE